LPRTSHRRARGRPDPASNPTLRRVLQNARAVNMPKDKTDAAIRRASGKEAANYQEIIYEGYAPHGVALLVETATDNPTRTVGSVRNIFTQRRQSRYHRQRELFVQENGRVSPGPAAVKDQDELELDLIDHGLEEMGESTGEKGEPQLVIRCAFNDFGKLQEALEAPRHHAAVRRARVHLCGRVPEEQAPKCSIDCPCSTEHQAAIMRRRGVIHRVPGVLSDRQTRAGRPTVQKVVVPHPGLYYAPGWLNIDFASSMCLPASGAR
jgi:transcriptional/translational regulatory protein YebC/TACO1